MFALYNIILYSILGFLFETGICALFNKTYNSGFTFGPYTLVYGISLTLMFAIFKYIQKRLNNNKIMYLIYFVVSFLLISVIEFIAGITIEKFFDIVFWDYSNMPLTIYKYVNVFVSVFWAIGSILIYKFLKPQTDKIFKYIKNWMLITMTSLILVDVFFSVINML